YNTVEEKWQALLDALFTALGVPAVYILLDGLDGVWETSTDPRTAVQILTPLLSALPSWSARRVYLKAFLPLEIHSILKQTHTDLLRKTHTTSLEWNPALLAEIVRRRVYVASKGAFGSLGPLATPDLHDLETLLAREVPQLPREMLVLTRRVLHETARRGPEARITAADIREAVAWYQATSGGL
ncbi:hypothetical protein D6833_12620, partial [Candidatus Parcubacteria bacterium]